MDRRTMLLGSAAALAAAASKGALAAAHQHQHQHAPSHNQALVDATSDCIQRGQACLHHCFELLAEGDKAMAACASSVNEMLAVCTALQQLASAQSRFLKGQARVALEVCKACEEECRKHADKHEECKACAEACVVCARECQKLAA